MAESRRLRLAFTLILILASACATAPSVDVPSPVPGTPAASPASPAAPAARAESPTAFPEGPTIAPPGSTPAQPLPARTSSEPGRAGGGTPWETMPAGSPRPAGGRAVPILMYHYIRVNPIPSDRLGYGLSVTPTDFEAQMAFLEARGFRSVTPAEIVSGVAFEKPGRPVAVTFDDGYDDALTAAYPALARHHLAGVFYVITDFVGRPGYLTWDQVRTLAGNGEVIGSHTVSHRDLTHLDAVTLYAELAVSRATIEGQVGQPVLDFCYPSGRNDLTVRQMVGSVGYRTAVTTHPGLARARDDPWHCRECGSTAG